MKFALRLVLFSTMKQVISSICSVLIFFLFIFANEVSGLLEVGMVMNIGIILPLAILVGTAIDKFSTLSSM